MSEVADWRQEGLPETKTAEIFKMTAPYSNPYQGTDKRLLFVCSAGLLRSATGANLYAKKGYNTRGCGSETYALIPLSMNLIKWADHIFFVNPENFESAKWTFDEYPAYLEELTRKSKVLNIPDNYAYNDPQLIKFLEDQVGSP